MNFLNLYDKPGFDLFLSMDCEGTNFDKNLKNNAMNLKKLLKLTSSQGIYTILFITPYFAEMMKELDLIEKLNHDYKIIYSLHIHPENLPEQIKKNCPFINDEFVYMTDYSYREQKIILLESLKYIESLGIGPIQGYRGGYYSMDDETSKILRAFTSIGWESHNIHRHEYKARQEFIRQIPVSAFDEKTELRLESYSEAVFDSMILNAKINHQKLLAITHSYLLDENDCHYKRDGIPYTVYEVMEKILDKIKTI